MCDYFLITSNKKINCLTKINNEGIFIDKEIINFDPYITKHEKLKIIPNF